MSDPAFSHWWAKRHHDGAAFIVKVVRSRQPLHGQEFVFWPEFLCQWISWAEFKAHYHLLEPIDPPRTAQ